LIAAVKIFDQLDDDKNEARNFELAVYASGGYRYLVNYRHVYEPIKSADLPTMKSLRSQDGKSYFFCIN